jgi:predicted MFS family arabinose efflux permease
MAPMANVRSLTAMGAFAMAGNTPLVAQPMVVGAMVDLLGMTERQAGILASVELTGLTLGILAIVPAVTRMKRSSLAVCAVSGIVAANVMTCFVTGFEGLLAIRFLSGFGAAAAFGVYMSMAASDPRPEHAFAIVNAISIAYSGLVNLLAPSLLHAAGLPGILISLALITALALATIPWLGQPDGPGTHPSARELFAPAASTALPLLAMMLLLYTGHGAIWAYQERIGVAAGLTEHAVGKWIGLSMLVWGVGGSLLARLLSMSLGRIWPQAISLGASCLAVLVLVYGSTPMSFATSCGLIAFSWFYGLPYQMGLLAARDPKGRAALAGVMMSTGGMALGPGIAAFLLVGRVHWPIGIFAGVCYLAALMIAVPAARNLNRVPTVVPA